MIWLAQEKFVTTRLKWGKEITHIATYNEGNFVYKSKKGFYVTKPLCKMCTFLIPGHRTCVVDTVSSVFDQHVRAKVELRKSSHKSVAYACMGYNLSLIKMSKRRHCSKWNGQELKMDLILWNSWIQEKLGVVQTFKWFSSQNRVKVNQSSS